MGTDWTCSINIYIDNGLGFVQRRKSAILMASVIGCLHPSSTIASRRIGSSNFLAKDQKVLRSSFKNPDGPPKSV